MSTESPGAAPTSAARSIRSTLAILFCAKLATSMGLLLLTVLGGPFSGAGAYLDVILCAWATWTIRPEVGPSLPLRFFEGLLAFVAFFIFICTAGALAIMIPWVLYAFGNH